MSRKDDRSGGGMNLRLVLQCNGILWHDVQMTLG